MVSVLGNNGNSWVRVLVYAGAWAVPCLASTLMLYLALPTDSQSGIISIFGRQAIIWLTLAVMTAAVYYFDSLVRSRFNSVFLRGFFFLIGCAIFTGVFSTISMLLDFASSQTAEINEVILRRRFIWNTILYWLILICVAVYRFYTRYRQNIADAAKLELEKAKLEDQLAQANLNALKAQLHPHFLFNSLNAVSALVRKGDRETTLRMIAELGTLFRRSIEGDSQHFVKLRRELEYIENYLNIEKLRFEERLLVRFDVDPATQDLLVPNLILQPIIENAIKHGIAENLQTTSLEIGVVLSKDRLEIRIYNSGPALPDGFSVDNNTGIGLRNTIDRLVRLYDDDFGFEIKNRRGQGVLVVIDLPIEPGKRSVTETDK